MKRTILLFLLLATLCGVIFFKVRERAATHAASLPVLPIELNYRKAMLGSGYVFTLKNQTNHTLSLRVTLINPTLRKTNGFAVTLDAGKLKEIGHLEGWSAAVGDMAQVESDGFAPKRGYIAAPEPGKQKQK